MFKMVIKMNDDEKLKIAERVLPSGVKVVSKGVYETEERFDFWVVMSALFGKKWFAESLLEWKWYYEDELIEDLKPYAVMDYERKNY